MLKGLWIEEGGSFMARNIAILLLGGVLAVCAAPARAQDAFLGQVYGHGVHAYFSGDYPRAHELMTAAIDRGMRDPRCYYFRGLSYLMLGRPQEADADFTLGAKLESKRFQSCVQHSEVAGTRARGIAGRTGTASHQRPHRRHGTIWKRSPPAPQHAYHLRVASRLSIGRVGKPRID